MNALDLMARLGGEILLNKIHVTVDGEIIIVAYLDEQNEWAYTEAGQLLADEHSNLIVSETGVVTKARKTKTQLVESVEVTSEPEVGLTQAAE